MDRYRERFAELRKKGQGAFVPFVTMGDPDYKTSLEIIKTLIDSGADALELGLAFSDPIADGKTIQAADVRALDAGIDTDKVFRLLNEIRRHDQKIPIGLLVYYNLVYSRGIEKFYADAKQAGVDGILVADVPLEEAKPLLVAAKKFGIKQIFIVAPTTTKKRLKSIMKSASGFVYLVARLGVTGTRENLGHETIELIKKVRPFTKLPICAGFGISKPRHVKNILKAGCDGAIAGSPVVKIIANNLGSREKMLKEIAEYVKVMKNAAL